MCAPVKPPKPKPIPTPPPPVMPLPGNASAEEARRRELMNARRAAKLSSTIHSGPQGVVNNATITGSNLVG